MARVFIEDARPPNKLELDWEAFAGAKEMDGTATALMEALKAESRGLK